MSKDTSEKKHNMKTRKDIKIKDGDIDYTKEFDIDKEDTNSVTLTEIVWNGRRDSLYKDGRGKKSTPQQNYPTVTKGV